MHSLKNEVTRSAIRAVTMGPAAFSIVGAPCNETAVGFASNFLFYIDVAVTPCWLRSQVYAFLQPTFASWNNNSAVMHEPEN